MWERNGQEIEVANYVRCLRRAEGPKSTPAHWTIVIRQQTELGLNIGGLLRNRWTITSDDEADASRPSAHTAGPSARERLKLVVAS
jgi:hypothetical protein